MRVRVLASGLALLLSLASPALSQETASPQSTPASPSTPAFAPERIQTELGMLRDRLNQALFDFPTARFQRVYAGSYVPRRSKDGKPVLVFCGEFNAKNRMGAYTGWEPFFAAPLNSVFETGFVATEMYCSSGKVTRIDDHDYAQELSAPPQ